MLALLPCNTCISYQKTWVRVLPLLLLQLSADVPLGAEGRTAPTTPTGGDLERVLGAWGRHGPALAVGDIWKRVSALETLFRSGFCFFLSTFQIRRKRNIYKFFF